MSEKSESGEVAALIERLRERKFKDGSVDSLCQGAADALARLSAPQFTPETVREFAKCRADLCAAKTELARLSAPVPALSDTLLNTIEALAQENFLREDYAEQCAYVLDFANRSQEAARNAATQIRALTKQHAEWVQAHQVDTDSAWRIVAKLTTEAKKLLALMPAIDPALGDETDRVFVWHEFDELRKAIDAAPVPDKEK